MHTLTEPRAARQVCSAMFTFDGGPLLAEGERIRPCGMDEIVHRWGESALDAVMENPGRWIHLEQFDAEAMIRGMGVRDA